MGEWKQKVSPVPSSLTTSPPPDLADRERRPELSPTDRRPISEPVCITTTNPARTESPTSPPRG